MMEKETEKITISMLIKECKMFIKTFFAAILVSTIFLFVPLTLISIFFSISTALMIYIVIIIAKAIVIGAFAVFRILETTKYID